MAAAAATAAAAAAAAAAAITVKTPRIKAYAPYDGRLIHVPRRGMSKFY
jgi:hypothetical protein